MTNAIDEALALSRDGRVDEAVELLRSARAAGPVSEAHLSLQFQLVTKHGATAESIELCDVALTLVKLPIARSNWSLRRGLAHLELMHRDAALADIQLVLKLKANEGHLEQARAALLRIAQLAKK